MGLVPGERWRKSIIASVKLSYFFPVHIFSIYLFFFNFQSSDSIDTDIATAPSLLLSPDPPPHSQPLSSGSTPGNSALDELDLLGKTLLQQSLPPEGLQVKWYLTGFEHDHIFAEFIGKVF